MSCVFTNTFKSDLELSVSSSSSALSLLANWLFSSIYRVVFLQRTTRSTTLCFLLSKELVDNYLTNYDCRQYKERRWSILISDVKIKLTYLFEPLAGALCQAEVNCC